MTAYAGGKYNNYLKLVACMHVCMYRYMYM